MNRVDETDTQAPTGSVQLAHMAFKGSDYRQFIEQVCENAIEFSERSLADTVASMTQVPV